MWPNTRILYYCHHPQHLIGEPLNNLMYYYFKFIELVERFCLSHADLILSNSNFTKGVLHRYMEYNLPNYKSLILYPCSEIQYEPIQKTVEDTNKKFMFTTIGRFWPSKMSQMLLDAATICTKVGGETGKRICITLAGSLDTVMPMSKQYFLILKKLAEAAKLDVRFQGNKSSKIMYVPNSKWERSASIFRFRILISD